MLTRSLATRSTVVDELCPPIAAEQPQRRNRGEPLTHGPVELRATSLRSERLLGPLQARSSLTASRSLSARAAKP